MHCTALLETVPPPCPRRQQQRQRQPQRQRRRGEQTMLVTSYIQLVCCTVLYCTVTSSSLSPHTYARTACRVRPSSIKHHLVAKCMGIVQRDQLGNLARPVKIGWRKRDSSRRMIQCCIPCTGDRGCSSPSLPERMEHGAVHKHSALPIGRVSVSKPQARERNRHLYPPHTT